MADASLWVLAGPSGSGRATALGALERAGVRCVDGLPVSLLVPFARLERTAPAVVTLGLAADSDGLTASVRDSGAGVLYLDADDRTLVRRLADSTRPHPCAAAGPGMAAITAERELLGPLRAVADAVVDTTDLLPQDLGARILSIVRPQAPEAERFTLMISSFGFKYGPQVEADWVIDVRFLPNPFWVPELRPLTGLDGEVAALVMGSGDGPALVARIVDLIGWVVTRAEAHGRRRLHLAVGCTGGRHRSVVVARALAERLATGGTAVTVRHRDLERPDPR